MFDAEYLARRAELEKRLKNLALKVIYVCNKLPNSLSNQIITKQLLRAIFSIGANYEEACEPESSSDFVHKISISKKEAREALYWIEILANSNPNLKTELRDTYTETKQVFLIFAKATATSKNNNKVITK